MARKQKMFHYIYKTTNLLSGKYYIGMHSTDNMDDGYLGSGKRLRYSINKYGEDNHKREILEYCNDRIELKGREEEIVNLNEIAKVECMNLKVGGEGGFVSLSACTKGGKISGKLHSERLDSDIEYRNKFIKRSTTYLEQYLKSGKLKERADWTGRKHSDETKEKMSESMKGKGKGKTNSQYGTCWITKDGENKKIKKEDLDQFIKEGWVKGRVK